MHSQNKIHNFFFHFPDRLIWLILCLASLMSCEEYQEGCMDATATNFKVSNQLPCCCEYPQLVYQTTFTDGKSTVSFADTFINQAGQRYLINDLRFIASGITLTDSLDNVYHPVDTFDNYDLPPDVLGVNVLELNSTGANFMVDGTYNRLNFEIAVVDKLSGKTPQDFPADHTFRDSSFYDFTRQNWVLASVKINVLDQGNITLDVFEGDSSSLATIQGKWTKRRGQDLVVNFKVNLNTLFGLMDFSLPANELKKTFKTNLPASFEP